MQTLIDLDSSPVFAIPLRDSTAIYEGVLVEGPQGWGEFGPPADAEASTLVRWLTAATEPGTVGWPDPMRGRIPIAATVPAVDPSRARDIAVASGCRSATVEVGTALADDVARVAAVREALGPDGVIRCDAKGRWDVDTAVAAIAELQRAAGGLEFVVQPCPSLADGARVRALVDVRIAADVSMLAAEGPVTRETADVAVVSCGPLGGARRALRVAEMTGLPCVVTSTVQTSIGLMAGLALAGALPELPYACELGGRALLAGDVVAQFRSLTVVDGFLPVAPMPPAPQPELIDRYAVTDPHRIAWWRDRLRAATALQN
ncbi:enolase C-terminal domain-like protein [Mycobacterium aquaticum]|uniref:O-succinylbenzoate synthase n=1 Tax=Mycobacterium aquaticum TaxID=1927124 RepID=A0A1X0A2V4_9MYCO|nr:enolase C-terminal domain-like protein [Mycobacterium aquaticum]ORA24379.1 O-succinylbenzoate synthase [Mycobacterium aquaticum]